MARCNYQGRYQRCVTTTLNLQWPVAAAQPAARPAAQHAAQHAAQPAAQPAARPAALSPNSQRLERVRALALAEGLSRRHGQSRFHRVARRGAVELPGSASWTSAVERSRASWTSAVHISATSTMWPGSAASNARARQAKYWKNTKWNGDHPRRGDNKRHKGGNNG